MLRKLLFLLGAVVAARMVYVVLGGGVSRALLVVGSWLLLGWMLARALPAMREDVRRVLGAVVVRRRGPRGGGF